MKIQNVTYNNFIEIVKDKINPEAIKGHIKLKVKPQSIKTELVDKKELFEEIKRFFKKMAQNNFSVSISVHQKTKIYVIKVIDNETKQVVREAPLEKILDMISFMEEFVKKRSLHRRM
jgi:uncharacterized FlaG/YvyC family protein